MEILIKPEHTNFKMPVKMHEHDAGFDCFVADVSSKKIDGIEQITYDLGFSSEIPENYFVLLVARSSICNLPLIQANSVGVIDSNYRGVWQFVTKRLGLNKHTKEYGIGERCCQFLILPKLNVDLVMQNVLSETDRVGGFGSTGK